MPSIETHIWLALMSRLSTLSTDPEMLIIEPNESFEPPVSPSPQSLPIPFILISDFRGPTTAVDLKRTKTIRFGDLMITPNFPFSWVSAMNYSRTQMLEVQGVIAQHFPPGRYMKSGPVCLRVQEEPSVVQPYREGSGLRSPLGDTYFRAPVRVSWSTD